ncbi:carbon storage regulator CsrA [Geomicrobium sp. JCM 19039]|uniref:carbon storage regulator CsrA n=1 Tax=Geomicrobium sp. JCM 19039 TaxID=1460636 RepID=UPI00045F445C|nr:carbon storage regulator CsrA [Geomicrobium sp. JCM 19039]GAK11639.1 carbon storage regulator [Geomicrobium sp. JCM 19039]
MLVLTRKADEAIKIGDQVEIKIIGIDNDQVKIGIEAPKHIDIHRKEIYIEIQEENKAAAMISEELFSQIRNLKN